MVASRLIPRAGEPILVDWRVRETDGRPQIIDVVVAGVSLVVTQRSEFQSVVQSKGFDGLMALLRQRIGQARPSLRPVRGRRRPQPAASCWYFSTMLWESFSGTSWRWS